jgi:hypothetical protein
MKKILKVIPIAVAMFSLASCGGSTVSSSTTPSASSSSTPTVSSSSDKTVAPSPSSSSNDTSSSSSSDSTPSVITKTVDMSTVTAHDCDKGDWSLCDNFFTLNIGADAGKDLKTNTSDKSLKRSIKFTTTGAGTVSMTARSGGSKVSETLPKGKGVNRKLYLVKLTSDGKIDKYLGDQIVGLTNVDFTFSFYGAGSYAILTNATCKIDALSVTYEDGKTIAEPTYSFPTVTDNYKFDPINIRPGEYDTFGDKSYGYFDFNGEISYKADRTIDTYTGYNEFLRINGQQDAEGSTNYNSGKFGFDNKDGATGTLTIYACENGKTDTVKIGYCTYESTSITYSTSYIQDEDNKTLTAYTISITSRDSKVYVVCDTGSIDIFYATFETI